MAKAGGGKKRITVSDIHPRETFMDTLDINKAKVILNNNGQGISLVNDGQVSVYVNEKLPLQIDQ